MKKLVLFSFIIIGAQAFAQPSGERQAQIQRFGQAMLENELVMNCERRIQQKDGVEKTVLQFFPFEHRLVSTISSYKKRTSWSAQIEIEGLRLGQEEGEKTHLKMAPVQKGGERLGELHLQMDLQEDFFRQVHLERRFKSRVIAYEKGNLNHPFICRFERHKIR